MLEQWENPEVLEAPVQIEHFKAFDAAIENIVA
jgi:quinol monooxygenase YgiN